MESRTMAELLRMDSPKVASIRFLSIRTSQRFFPGASLRKSRALKLRSLGTLHSIASYDDLSTTERNREPNSQLKAIPAVALKVRGSPAE